MRNQRILLLRALDRKLAVFKSVLKPDVPENGWIRSIRTSLNITLEQLGARMGKSKQSITQMEKSEAQGSITLKNLREMGNALELKLVYGFIPNDGSLEKLLERKAETMAKKIVLSTHQHMRLEDQANSNKEIDLAIKELTLELKNEMHKSLWD